MVNNVAIAPLLPGIAQGHQEVPASFDEAPGAPNNPPHNQVNPVPIPEEAQGNQENPGANNEAPIALQGPYVANGVVIVTWMPVNVQNAHDAPNVQEGNQQNLGGAPHDGAPQQLPIP